MAEFASKGVAGSGLGLGIAGTALGGLFGNNNQATISALQAENYSDKNAKEVYNSVSRLSSVRSMNSL